jgi:hypothetical protein
LINIKIKEKRWQELSSVTEPTQSPDKIFTSTIGSAWRCPMQHTEDHVMRSALLAELSRMKKLGFLIVDEAFDVAQTLDLEVCRNLPLTALAFMASERGYAEFKSRLQREVPH